MKKRASIRGRLPAAIALALASLSAGSATAAGLGRLTVTSALGEALKAEVEVISLSGDEGRSVSVRLASPDAYRRASVDYDSVLSDLRVTTNRRPDGRVKVSISSNRPVNEPVVELLVELESVNGSVLRQYSVLLDPPVLRSNNSPSDAVEPLVPSGGYPTIASPLKAPASPVSTLATAQYGERIAAPRQAVRPAPRRIARPAGETMRPVMDAGVPQLAGARPDRAPKATAINPAKADGHGGAAVSPNNAEIIAAAQLELRRVELEKTVNDLRQRIESKDKEIAEFLAASKDPAAGAPVTDAARVEAAVTSPAAEPVKAEPIPIVDGKVAEPMPALDVGPIQAIKPDAPPKPTIVQAPPPEEGFFEDPMMMSGAAGILALVAGGAFIAMRRRQKPSREVGSLFTDTDDSTDSIGSLAAARLTTLPAAEVSAIDESPSHTIGVHETEVDPLAEAQTYIAYGRQAQAEEIMKDALVKDPERLDVRMALLELYAGRKDTQAFNELAASTLGTSSGAAGWPSVANLGLQIDPTNPMYRSETQTTALAPVDTEIVAGDVPPMRDLDFVSVTPTVDVKVEEAEAAPLADTHDFDLDFDPVSILGTTPDNKVEKVASHERKVEPAREDGALTVADLEFPAIRDFELQPDIAVAAAKPLAKAAVVPASLEAAPSKLDDTAKAEPATTQQAIETDSMVLDIDPPTLIPYSVNAENEAMEIKLELAKAYLDIGDADGAQELLREVIEGGEAVQKAKARNMLVQAQAAF